MTINNYRVRINIKREDLDYIDFSRIDKGVILLKNVENKIIWPGNYYIHIPIKLECFIDGYDSSSTLILDKELYNIFNGRIKLKTKNPLRGTYDHLKIKIESTGIEAKEIKAGTTIGLLIFTTTRFYELQQKNETEGIQPASIDIEIYIDGIFKPHNANQLHSKGLVIIKDENYIPGANFYDLNYIDYAKNFLDSKGVDLDEPLFDISEEYPK